MRERNVVVLPLGPFLGKVSGKGRVPMTDVFCGNGRGTYLEELANLSDGVRAEVVQIRGFGITNLITK